MAEITVKAMGPGKLKKQWIHWHDLTHLKGLQEFVLLMTLNQIPSLKASQTKFERLNPEYRPTVLGFDSKYDKEETHGATKWRGSVSDKRIQ